MRADKTASRTPEMMKRFDFDVHDNVKCFLRAVWGSDIKFTDRNSFSKTKWSQKFSIVKK